MPDLLEQIEMPVFSPAYHLKTKYGYNNRRYKKNLRDLLNDTSNDFCMYCYIRVAAEGKKWGHLEHAIEKANSDYLTECVPNIGWTCSVCNGAFKKEGEEERMLPRKDIMTFEKELHCISNDCKKECVKYKNLRKKYLAQPNSHIILQPNGVKGSDTGLDLRVQYNVQKALFEASDYQGKYSDAEKGFIEDHINKFHLNDERYKTNALMTFLEDVVNSDGYISHMQEINMVVYLFKKRLEGLEKEQVRKICEKLYTYYTAKLKESDTI